MDTIETWPDNIRAGEYEQHEPLVRRVLAPNPSPYTYTGTQTWIVGNGADVAVIDPGPYTSVEGNAGESTKLSAQASHLNSEGHIEAILRAVEGRRVAAIVCTHTHRDHSPAAIPLKQQTGAQIIGCAPLVLEDAGPRADAAFDASYAPDQILSDGEVISGDGWTLRAVATPGHTSNHLCYALEESKALFTGDHVMGWSTTVVSPPDGDMTAYMASLAKLYDRSDRIYYPAHGSAIEKPQQRVRAMIGHRKHREKQIIDQLAREGAQDVNALVAAMYEGLDSRLLGAAGQSVRAHLFAMEQRGILHRVGDRVDDIWSLSK